MATIQQPQINSPTTVPTRSRTSTRSIARAFVTYALVGAAFGIVLIKGEVVSWYRIQEMFRFESFHMYGILGSAMLTALVSVQILRRVNAHALTGEQIAIPDKDLGRGHRYWIGGLIFGAGWALTGACPGPLFALVGSGATVFVATAAAALAGTWTYGYLRPRLPH
jgi:uncharacterized membrane protein YedE/YeeE